MSYNPANWYWSGPLGVFSSAAGAIVLLTDATYAAWLAGGNVATPWPKDATDWQTAAALDAVLEAAGLPATGLAPVTKASLIAYAANKRFAIETGGITVNGVAVDTTRESQSMLANASAYVAASGAASVSYKANSGWVTLDAATVKAVAVAVGAHVQAAFTAENEIDTAINAGTITTTAQIDAFAWVV